MARRWIPWLLLAWPWLVLAAPSPPDEAEKRGLAELESYEVESTRSPVLLIEAPLAISVVSREEIVPARPAVDLAEALELVPGVFAQSSRNFAQDTRVAIRGFGSRATFGIRGIKVLVDGVPTTLPDGQSEVDSIDLAFVDRLEVIRGPISSLYGGGSGGILSIQTVQPTEQTTLRARALFGTNHLSRYEALARGTLGGTGYVLGLASTRTSGYRDHARARQSVLLAKLQRSFADGTDLALAFSSVWAPEAQDPGGLTALEVDEDRTDAGSLNRRFDTGEDLDQQKIAFTLRRPLWEDADLRLMSYWLHRDFDNKLPFRQVDLKRNVGGGALLYTDAWRRLRWTAGVDLDVQRDQRRNFDNQDGARGALSLDQREDVTAVGPFAQAELDLGRGFSLVGGLRYDWTEFEVHDRFTTGPLDDESDSIRFRELSPRFGMRWSRSPRLSLHAGYSTGFQVPTTTELRPALGGGFDSDREPERSVGLELGAKGMLGDRLLYDVALFQIEVRDALVPFEENDVIFFRNAGEVRRRGAEVALSAVLRPGVSVRSSYTFADYRYTDYKPFDPATGGIADFDGNREPNTARHTLGGELRFEHPSGLFGVLSLRHFSDIEVNDANTEESAGATISEARVGYDWWRDRLLVRPFAGVRNWTGVEYDGSIRPNALGGRFYEPAPEIEVYGGLEIRLSLGDAL